MKKFTKKLLISAAVMALIFFVTDAFSQSTVIKKHQGVKLYKQVAMKKLAKKATTKQPQMTKQQTLVGKEGHTLRQYRNKLTRVSSLEVKGTDELNVKLNRLEMRMEKLEKGSDVYEKLARKASTIKTIINSK